jgi:DNA-directed RNA polymerase specialized sigma24 family protein
MSGGEFGKLLEGHIPKLRRYARSLTRNEVHADDLVQDCLCRAIRKHHLFQPDIPLYLLFGRLWMASGSEQSHCKLRNL